MGFRRHSTSEPRVELTPMVDVVFLLLIFFMISTTFVENPGLKINLPQAAAHQLKHEGKELQVYLTADGRIFCQREEVTHAGLVAKLNSFGPAAKQMTFLLMADREARHGQVIQLMDAAKTAGFEKLAIATDKKTTSDEAHEETNNE